MPEKISWIKHPKDKMEKREQCHNLLSPRGSSFSINLSSSPPKILSMSSPMSIPWPSVPLSLSTSPQRTKSSPSSSQDGALCQLPQGNKMIENVLIRAKLSRQNAVTTMTTPTQDSGSPPDNSLLTIKQTKEQGETGDVSEGGSGGGPRLSDGSLSSDSSDSLDFSQSFASILPPLYDPSPPTTADYTIHLPLSYLPYCSMGEGDEEGDDEDEQEPEPDYGVNLESDQEPPRPPPKRRSSAGALIIQKALQGKLRKMSATWERVPAARLGRPTPQDLELLQTLRQFIPQMKSYLRQSSELEPPIESFIPEDHIGRFYGADDFLPVLTYVLAQCDMPQLDNEILYMMELLDPSLLHGEGGYYLTSAYGAMSLIRNFQEEQAARVLSSETRNTLCQWHRRRTTQRSTPSIEDFQNYLRVALQELDSGCTAKTLQVQPYTTVEEVCQLCTQKFKVSDPENYGLFLVTGGSSQQLAPDTHPQKIKAELHSRPQAAPFHFVFRRMANQNTSSSTPLNPALSVTSDPQDNSSELSTSCPQRSPSLGLNPSLSLSLPPDHVNGRSISI
ncbi:ras and Rab interactor 2-like [Thalassophryne amazonica]|uniref:ras and Rab interactor 2-like n=1 Tax=Thalassophryne amazonica TaxID=390379 RepID=UPI001471678D|nr:ras and Rab interactor 2-like [Thalassophryne amazonica]